jgi:hypothetical protein
MLVADQFKNHRTVTAPAFARAESKKYGPRMLEHSGPRPKDNFDMANLTSPLAQSKLLAFFNPQIFELIALAIVGMAVSS